MKRIFTLSGLVCMCAGLFAQPLKTPSPSTAQTIKQELGIGSVELSYSRPNMKGRKIFGDLVPFGKVWRTGANSATTISFTDTVTIGGVKIPAGKYGLVSIPEAGTWTFIVTKQLNVAFASDYKASEDLVRVKAEPMVMKDALETFTMQFGDVKANSTNLYVLWENTAVSLPITMDVNTRVMAQIDNLMNRDNKPYFTAAMYYMDNGKDLNQALTWLNKATELNPTAYWALHQKANCLAKLGKKEEAKAAARQSIEAAKQAKNDDYVALNEKLLATLK